MKSNALIMTAMACVTVIFVATTRSPAQNNNASAVGRYQITSHGYGFVDGKGKDEENNDVWVIDTVTSETWYYTGSTWRSAGRPD